MKAICVDDEPLAVEYTIEQCASLREIREIKGFTDAKSALDYLRCHMVDLALLDINMPEIDGITLAERIKKLCPHTAILFLTAYREYAFDAYSVHPSGYLLKPVSMEKLAAEVRYVCRTLNRVDASRFSAFLSMSRNVNRIYCIHWCILGFVDSVFCYLMGIVFPWPVIYLIGIALIVVSAWIASRWERRQQTKKGIGKGDKKGH